MPNRTVISDASTVIGLQNTNSLELLRHLYDEVEITSIVREEIGTELPSWIAINDTYNALVYRSMLSRLDRGEASAIALALEYEDALLIIDERKGRRIATEQGLRITGIVGVIIRAKKEGYLSSGKDRLDELVRHGFRLSPTIYQLALKALEEE